MHKSNLSTHTSRIVRGLAVVPLLVLTACDADSAERDAASITSSPTATARKSCDLLVRESAVSFGVDLPEGLASWSSDESGCTWGMGVRVGEPGSQRDAQVVVSVAPVSPGTSLMSRYEKQARFAVDDDEAGGDDAIYSLRLLRDVPVFGGETGDLLAYRCYCDGQENLTRMAQANGIVFEWNSVKELTEDTDRQFARALSSGGISTE